MLQSICNEMIGRRRRNEGKFCISRPGGRDTIWSTVDPPINIWLFSINQRTRGHFHGGCIVHARYLGRSNHVRCDSIRLMGCCHSNGDVLPAKIAFTFKAAITARAKLFGWFLANSVGWRQRNISMANETVTEWATNKSAMSLFVVRSFDEMLDAGANEFQAEAKGGPWGGE